MERFKQVENGTVLTYSKGVYQQRKLFERARHLYAGHGSGFVMLYANGVTSLPGILWKEIDAGLEGLTWQAGPGDRLVLASTRPLSIAS